ncbi:MAG: sigma-70 family RNA polymerase sigma factor [Akkermansiaceae bacterium]|nr:sigma-70 family RNA polymerase sigma factor [Akkermansiaceae bacterium]
MHWIPPMGFRMWTKGTEQQSMEESDCDLMTRLGRGDDLALNVLMDRWSARIISFLYRMSGRHDTAVDLAQETFVKLYAARERYRATGNFSTYLFGIAVNLYRNHLRWLGRHPSVSLDGPGQKRGELVRSSFVSPSDQVERAETWSAVEEALRRLPVELREAISFYVYEGMTYAEIAGITKCTVKAVENRIYRARQILREELKEVRK